MHSSPLFKNLNLLKLPDIIKLYTASFMHQYNKGTLPENFNNFFPSVRSKHQHSTRLASKSTFSLPSARTNYGIFSIRFQGPKVWNNIDESLKSLSYSNFKLKVKEPNHCSLLVSQLAIKFANCTVLPFMRLFLLSLNLYFLFFKIYLFIHLIFLFFVFLIYQYMCMYVYVYAYVCIYIYMCLCV